MMEILKTKIYKYKRNPNRIYTIMDFEDGEKIKFFSYPDKPSSKAEGYGWFSNSEGYTRLLHFNEVEENKEECCETCAFYNTDRTDQPCCGCFEYNNWEIGSEKNE